MFVTTIKSDIQGGQMLFIGRVLGSINYFAYTPLCRWYIKHIHHFAKRTIFSIVSDRNAASPSRIMEHPVGSARKGFAYEITPQSRRESSLKFWLSLCTGCAKFCHLWSLAVSSLCQCRLAQRAKFVNSLFTISFTASSKML